MNNKVCSSCNREKSIDCFGSKSRKMRSGEIKNYTNIYCKNCVNEKSKNYRRKNSEKIKKYNRSDAKKNANKKWLDSNLDSRKEYERQYYLDKIKERRLQKNKRERANYDKNKEKSRKKISREQFKKEHKSNRAQGNYTDIIITKDDLLVMDDIRCSNCKTYRIATDFYIRKKRKQDGSIEDYIDPKCKFCNLNKNKYWYLQSTEIVEKFIKEKRQITKIRERNRNLTPSQRKTLYKKEKLKTNKSFKLRENVSRAVAGMLTRNNSGKNGGSVMDYLEYSIDDLKNHIEQLFEPWMNWDNWGPYIANKWDDNDQSTWKWNLDHIIPHSTFNYTSMDSCDFKKCWALNNLRPYNAKKNILDGATKARHI